MQNEIKNKIKVKYLQVAANVKEIPCRDSKQDSHEGFGYILFGVSAFSSKENLFIQRATSEALD